MCHVVDDERGEKFEDWNPRLMFLCCLLELECNGLQCARLIVLHSFYEETRQDARDRETS